MKKLFLLLLMSCFFAGNSMARSSKIKTNYRNALILAYSQANSVYEDENIKLEIYDERLWATNKTKKTIFIDQSQCFLIHNGASRPLFDTTKQNQGDKKASKKGVSSNADVMITLAPNTGGQQSETFIASMSTGIYGNYSTSESPTGDFTEYDKRMINVLDDLLNESQDADPRGKEYFGTATRHMTEDESINNIGASIAYAFNKKAEEWTNVSLTTWVSDVIFAPYYVKLPKELKKKDKRGFGVKETDPAIVHIKSNSPFEFEEDRAPIIVCDWTGNFKKGTFELTTTRISKTKGPGVGRIIGAIFTYGMTLLNSWNEQYYKSIIRFDGEESDWGKLIYSNGINQTSQESK